MKLDDFASCLVRVKIMDGEMTLLHYLNTSQFNSIYKESLYKEYQVVTTL